MPFPKIAVPESIQRAHHIQGGELLALTLVTLSALLLRTIDTRLALGIAISGVLTVLNFYGLRALLGGLFRSSNTPRQVILGGVLLLKFLVMGLALYATIRYLPVSGLGMVVGTSLAFLSVIGGGIRSYLLHHATEKNLTNRENAGT